jgi:hypothetical protein
MGAFLRVATALFERGDRDRLVEWYGIMKSVRAEARLERAGWGAAGELEVALTARLTWSGGEPIRFNRVGDRVFLDRTLAERFDLDPEVLDVTGELAAHDGDLSVSHREERVHWPCPSKFEQILTEGGDGAVTIGLRASGSVPTEAFEGRERLSRGLWDVHVGLVGFGISRGLRLGVDRDPDVEWNLGPAVLGTPARGVLPYFTHPKGELTVDVGKKARSLVHHLAGRRAERIKALRPALLLDVATAPSTAPVRSTMVVEDGAGNRTEVSVAMRPFEGRWRLALPWSVPAAAPGNGRLFMRLDAGASPPLLLCDVHIGPGGTLSVDRHLASRTEGPVGAAADLAWRFGHMLPAWLRRKAKRLFPSRARRAGQR